MRKLNPLNKTLKIRVANLRALMAAHEGAAGLAKKLGYNSPRFLYQITGEQRSITEKLARRWEMKFKLPAGWMDEAR